jgi:hypothetical protein
MRPLFFPTITIYVIFYYCRKFEFAEIHVVVLRTGYQIISLLTLENANLIRIIREVLLALVLILVRLCLQWNDQVLFKNCVYSHLTGYSLIVYSTREPL